MLFLQITDIVSQIKYNQAFEASAWRCNFFSSSTSSAFEILFALCTTGTWSLPCKNYIRLPNHPATLNAKATFHRLVSISLSPLTYHLSRLSRFLRTVLSLEFLASENSQPEKRKCVNAIQLLHQKLFYIPSFVQCRFDIFYLCIVYIIYILNFELLLHRTLCMYSI